MRDSGLTRKVAAWAAATELDALPRRVVDEAKHQLLSVVASIHAGHFSEFGRAVRRAVRDGAPAKDATIIPAGERTTLPTALFANAALSAALDYDDYLVAAQASHAPVVASLALAEKNNLAGKNVLLAQVVANEVVGRVGLALSPRQLAFPVPPALHLLGGAVAAAKLLGLDADATARAIDFALAHPGEALVASHVGAEGRAFQIAAATQLGVQAAQLAATGLHPASDVLGGDGLLGGSSRVDLGAVFDSLGQAWLTETLGYKSYPVHAAFATIVDCLLDLIRQHGFDGRKIRSVDVATTHLALEVDALAGPYLAGPETPSGALAYSIAYTVAAAALDKELTARQLTRERIADEAVWRLAERVQTSRDEVFSERARAAWLARSLGSSDHFAVDLDPLHVTQFRMSAGARVRIELEDGKVFQAEQEVPAGATGRAYDDRRKTVEDKFRRETRYSLRKQGMERAIDIGSHFERANAASVREFIRLCCSERD